MTGQTISHYRIVEKLGEGGMGAVYKAEDIRLGRTVALKFLLPHLVTDESTRHRFLREAQAAAALSHPNICTVYEIDDQDGRTFIAMEFVEGPSVAQTILPADGPARPLAFDEALQIAIQTAEGLQEAHENGVVHRDIKSANVLLSKKGQAKITDFGLAHLAERSRLTKSGSTMGTPSYMSPEQAQNLPTNHRTDIWSLGVMLYEMLTGRLPFEGQYEQAVVYSIINEDPPPVTSLRAGLPLEVERVLRKCLAKKADERFQHIDDTLVELRALRSMAKEAPAAAEGQSRPTRSEPAASPKSLPKIWHYLPWAVATLSTVMALMLAALFWSPASVPRQGVDGKLEFEIHPPAGTRLVPSYLGGAVTISPDGSKLAFVGRREDGSEILFLRNLDSTQSVAIAGTEGARSPFWSPDSHKLGFAASGQLKTVDLESGIVRSLAKAPRFLGGTWLDWRGGTILFAPEWEGVLYSTPVDGSSVTPVTRLQSEETSHSWPTAIEGGRFLFASYSKESAELSVFAAELRDGTPVESRMLTKAGSPAQYGLAGEQGYILFAAGGTLMAQGFAADRMGLQGPAIPIAQGLEFLNPSNIGGRATTNFSVSLTGSLIYRISEGYFGAAQLAWLNRQGQRLGTVGPPFDYGYLSLSPDNTTAAAAIAPRGGRADVWTVDLSRSAFTQRTFHTDHLDRTPVWSPDSHRLLISSNRDNAGAIFILDLEKDEEPRPFQATESRQPSSDWPTHWARQAGPILFHRSAGSDFDIWEYKQAENPQTRLLIGGPGNQFNGRLSPDGGWIAYVSDEMGSVEVFLRRYPPSGDKIRISTAGGNYPLWGADSRELFYLSDDGGLVVVSVDGGVRPPVGKPEKLFQTTTPFTAAPFVYQYAVARDSKRFLVVTETQSNPATLVLNWQAKLGQ